ncbi:MAG: hypothetical protein AAF449_06405, partial [Myxococcota bacterium]
MSAAHARRFRRGPGSAYRKLQSLRFLLTRDLAAVRSFFVGHSPLSPRHRLGLLHRFVHITNHVRGYHTLAEMLQVAQVILRLSGRPDLTVIEAGAGYGSSTAKLSWAVAEAGGRLLVFDSFRG